MSTVIRPKGDRVYGRDSTARAWSFAYLTSSIGNKAIVAVTGLSLTFFVLAHMVGNAKMFSGRDSINAYAYFLKHDLGILIWVARASLLGIFVAHIAITITLKWRAKQARPIGYAYQRVAQATLSSRTMLLTGLTIAAFTLFHLAHYSFGWVAEAKLADGSVVNYMDLRDVKGHHDVYNMVIAGFRTWWISALYIVAQLILFVHMSHGVQSSLQTLGLVGRRFTPTAKAFGYLLAATIVAGNLLIVAAVWGGYLPPVEPESPQAAPVKATTK